MARHRSRSSQPHPQRRQPRVKAALCATCLVDQFYPEVGEASVKVLRRLGVDVSFPEDQTCCGQIAFNGGYRHEAEEVARHFLDVFEQADYVVIPSGSCGTMVKVFYLELFEHDPEALERAKALSAKTHELTEFIVNVLGVTDAGGVYNGKVTYHDSCHLLRELRISKEPRALIENVDGADLTEMNRSDICCGFGGLFSVKYPHISMAILDEKLADIEASGAGAVVATDCGCLMHMGGAMRRRGMQIRPLHIAELLASEGEG